MSIKRFKWHGLYGGLVADGPLPYNRLHIELDQVAAVIEIDPEAIEDSDTKQACIVVLNSGVEFYLEKASDDVVAMLKGIKQAEDDDKEIEV